jgi:Family of unknown function (DUF5941)
MSAEELASNQSTTEPVPEPVARDVARWASSLQLAPAALAAIALGFGVIAAAWLTVASVRAAMIAFAALLAAFVAGRAARLLSGQVLTASTEWGLAVCTTLTELAVYAGIAGSAMVNRATAGMTGPVGSRLLHRTFLASFGGPGAGGVWRLATAAAITLAVLQMAGVCLAAKPATGGGPRRFQVFTATPGGARLLLIGAAFLLAGARVAFLLVIVLGAAGFCAMLASGGESEPVSGWLPACRGDGPLAAWIGRFVGGRLPPLPPLLVGLLVTGMLASLGLQNLSGILVFTPVEAMLLAALASWHPHHGRSDWLAPPLLQAGECVFIAAAGFAGREWPPVTFALLAAIGLRHLDIAYRARSQLPSGRFAGRKRRLPHTDRRGLGWDGRMVIAGVAVAAGIVPSVFPVLAVYLWAVVGWDFAVGWPAGFGRQESSAGHAAVDG